MNRKFKIILFAISIVIATVLQLNSQTIKLFDIDPSNYPNIKAKFFAFDALGAQKSLSPSDLNLKENQITRTIQSVNCTSSQQIKALSSVLVIDVSGSMLGGIGNDKNIDLAKTAAKAWVNGLPQGKSECAITSFNHLNFINQDFTSDKQKLINSIDNLFPDGGTDYDAAFISPMAGALLVSVKGKNQKVIVMLTDGLAYPPNTNAILTEANRQNCIIYCVTLGMPTPQSLKDIAIQTGGMYYENVTTLQEAEQIYRSILQTSQGSTPCEINWLTNCQQDSLINVDLSWLNTKDSEVYTQPQSAKASLNINPISHKFRTPIIGSDVSQNITISANNNMLTISDIISSNPQFSVTPKSFVLQPNESKDISLKYRALDSGLSFSKFSILTDGCNQEFYASGGFSGKKPTRPTLKLTHPNGNELFVVGSDTIITWEGVSPNDTVQIDFSSNNGKTWNSLAKNVNKLRHKWNDVPPPTSINCRIRVRQGVVVSNGNSNKVNAPDIVNQEIYGGYEIDVPTSIIESGDGSFLIVGSTESSNLTNKRGGIGNTDVWVIKLDPNGSLLWQKTYGGTNFERAVSITETKDGSFVILGESKSNDLDLQNKKDKNSLDYWIFKIDEDGMVIWQKTFGGTQDDFASKVIETKDGTLLLLGTTFSNDLDIINKRGGTGNLDINLLRLSSNGNLLWQKTYGGTKDDLGSSVKQIADGSFVIAGTTYSDDRDITNKRSVFVNNADFWILKTDDQGNILWKGTYGGSNNDITSAITENSDGDLIAVGTTNSSNLDISNKRGGAGNNDIWITKLNSNGDLLWQRTFGGTGSDSAFAITEVSDGSLVLAGNTTSSDLDVSDKSIRLDGDAWIVKFSKDGNIIWEKTSQVKNNDNATFVFESKDGLLNVIGNRNGVINSLYDIDYWFFTLNSDTPSIQQDESDTTFSIVAPIAKSRDIDVGQAFVNSTKDSLYLDFVRNTGSYPFQVKNITFTGNDATSFSLVSGVPIYTVSPNRQSLGEFRFNPKRNGIHQAQIQIVTQSDTLIQNITGFGVTNSIMLLNNIIDFGTVPVGQNKDTLQTATISNTGTIPIQITRIRHGLPNDKDFTTINGSTPFTLLPGSTHKMDLRFSPSDVGLTSGVLEFSYNGNGSPAVVQLFGRGISGPKITSTYPISVLKCADDTVTSIDINNPGNDTLILYNASISGSQSSEFSILNTFPISIASNGSIRLDIKYYRSNTGKRNANLLIRTNINDKDSIHTIPLEMQVEEILLAFEKDTIDFGILKPGSIIDTSVLLKNIGTLSTPFQVFASAGVSQFQSSVVQSASTLQIPFRLNISAQQSLISEFIIIRDNVCGKSDTVILVGKSLILDTVRTTVSLPSIIAKAGDSIIIPLKIIESYKLDIPKAPINFTATIGLNPTLIFITDKSITGTPINSYNSHYVINGKRTGDSILVKIPALATLGTTDKSLIELVSFSWLDTLVANEVKTINGSITLTDLCEEGGVRLFIPGGVPFSLTTRPNPTSNIVDILFGLVEPSSVIVRIIDYTGKIIGTPIVEPLLEAGSYSRSIDVSMLPIGPYIVLLSSTNVNLPTRMDIIR